MNNNYQNLVNANTEFSKNNLIKALQKSLKDGQDVSKIVSELSSTIQQVVQDDSIDHPQVAQQQLKVVNSEILQQFLQGSKDFAELIEKLSCKKEKVIKDDQIDWSVVQQLQQYPEINSEALQQFLQGRQDVTELIEKLSCKKEKVIKDDQIDWSIAQQQLKVVNSEALQKYDQIASFIAFDKNVNSQTLVQLLREEYHESNLYKYMIILRLYSIVNNDDAIFLDLLSIKGYLLSGKQLQQQELSQQNSNITDMIFYQLLQDKILDINHITKYVQILTLYGILNENEEFLIKMNSYTKVILAHKGINSDNIINESINQFIERIVKKCIVKNDAYIKNMFSVYNYILNYEEYQIKKGICKLVKEIIKQSAQQSESQKRLCSFVDSIQQDLKACKKQNFCSI